MALRSGVRPSDVRPETHVEELGVDGDALHRTGRLRHRAANHSDPGSARFRHGYLARLEALIPGLGHLLRGGQVRPQLESTHPAPVVTPRHLLVDDAAAGRHPLHVAAPDGARVPEGVPVVDLALEHVGDGLDAAMGMPGESRAVERGIVATEIVKHEEGIEKGLLAGAEGPAKMHAGAFYRRPAGLYTLDLPYRVHRAAIPPLHLARNSARLSALILPRVVQGWEDGAAYANIEAHRPSSTPERQSTWRTKRAPGWCSRRVLETSPSSSTGPRLR